MRDGMKMKMKEWYGSSAVRCYDEITATGSSEWLAGEMACDATQEVMQK